LHQIDDKHDDGGQPERRNLVDGDGLVTEVSLAMAYLYGFYKTFFFFVTDKEAK